MELSDDKIYSMNEFREYLRGLGLPCSRPYLIQKERQGVIGSPRLQNGAKNPPRAYTAQQVVQYASALKSLITKP